MATIKSTIFVHSVRGATRVNVRELLVDVFHVARWGTVMPSAQGNHGSSSASSNPTSNSPSNTSDANPSNTNRSTNPSSNSSNREDYLHYRSGLQSSLRGSNKDVTSSHGCSRVVSRARRARGSGSMVRGRPV